MEAGCRFCNRDAHHSKCKPMRKRVSAGTVPSLSLSFWDSMAHVPWPTQLPGRLLLWTISYHLNTPNLCAFHPERQFSFSASGQRLYKFNWQTSRFDYRAQVLIHMLENKVPVDIRCCFHSLKLTTVTNRALEWEVNIQRTWNLSNCFLSSWKLTR